VAGKVGHDQTSVWDTRHCRRWMENIVNLNTLRTGDEDLRFYITTVQDGW